MRVEAKGQGRGTIEVFSISGQKVRTLFNGYLEGRRDVTWDGRTSSGQPAAAGVYFVQLVTPAGSTAQRVVVIH
jgi:flagellar hook assembly protein FlgD